MKSLMGESVTEVRGPTEDPTKLGNVIGKPTKSCTWNEDAKVMPGCFLRGCGSGFGGSSIPFFHRDIREVVE
jgi:hypothetical protein